VRARIATFAALIAALAVLVPALASHGAPRSGLVVVHAAQELSPPQGVYEGCAPGDGVRRCAARIERIAGAGFTHVLNYSAWYGTAAEVRSYASAARKTGVKLIWPLNHPAWTGSGRLRKAYARLAPGCRCRGNRAFLAYAIGLVRRLPATWGFYVGDEELPELAPRVERLSLALRRLAPGRPQLYIARPGRTLLAPFVRFVDIAGADSYPIGFADPPVAQTAAETRDLTEAAGVRTAMVLQAFSWSQYMSGLVPDFPSEEEMRAMRDDAILFGRPDLILWYSYQDITRSAKPNLHWKALRRAAFS
jgi:hypothetical protein